MIRRLLGSLAVLAVATSPAAAQSAWQQAPAGAPAAKSKSPSTVFGTGSWGGGLNTRVSVDAENNGALGFGGTVDFKLSSWVGDNLAIGMYAHVTLREWEVIGDVYSALAENVDELTVPLFFVGWLAGTDIAYAGPSLSLYSRRETPSLFADGGAGMVILVDATCPDATTGVGFMAGAGVHITRRFGIAVRTVWTPPSLHHDLSSVDQTYYTAFLALEHYVGK